MLTHAREIKVSMTKDLIIGTSLVVMVLDFVSEAILINLTVIYAFY